MPTATFSADGDLGQAKTTRPEEIVRYTISHATSGQPITRYDLTASQPGHYPGGKVPYLLNPNTGAYEHPAQEVFLNTAATSTDTFDEETHTFTSGDTTTTLWVARHGNMVNRWKTTIGGSYSYDVEWLAESGPLGLGQSLGGAERIYEYGRVSSRTAHGNPTFAGMRPLPTGSETLGNEVNVPVAFPLYTNITSSYIETANVPFMWWSGEANLSPHGEDTTHVAAYWRHKQYHRITPHIGGREFLHRVTVMTYQPRSWEAEDFGHPAGGPPYQANYLECTVDNVCTAMDYNGFDQGFSVDAGGAGPELLEFAGFDSGTEQRWQCHTNDTIYILGGVTQSITATLAASGYLGLCYSRSSDQFTVGTIAKLTNTLNGISRLGKTTGLNHLELVNGTSPYTIPGVSTPSHEHPGLPTLVSRCLSLGGRDAGWVGYHTYIYVGPRDQFVTVAQEAYTSGLLDEVPDFAATLPTALKTGTELGG